MRKLSLKNMLILMAIAAVVAPSVGCGRCRGLFRRGCTTTPAVLGAPVTMCAPVAPVAVSAECCCPPCGTCKPCISGCGECSGSMAGYEPGYISSPTTTATPQSAEPVYRDPGPTASN